MEKEDGDGTDSTEFSIYWLVPNESYTVQIDLNYDSDTINNDCEESVDLFGLEEGEPFDLNGGQPIDKDVGICI